MKNSPTMFQAKTLDDLQRRVAEIRAAIARMPRDHNLERVYRWIDDLGRVIAKMKEKENASV